VKKKKKRGRAEGGGTGGDNVGDEKSRCVGFKAGPIGKRRDEARKVLAYNPILRRGFPIHRNGE